MKTIITTTDGHTVIKLVPESIFEKDLFDKLIDNEEKITLDVKVSYETSYSCRSDECLLINVEKKKIDD
jgi:hypothetical protein